MNEFVLILVQLLDGGSSYIFPPGGYPLFFNSLDECVEARDFMVDYVEDNPPPFDYQLGCYGVVGDLETNLETY